VKLPAGKFEKSSLTEPRTAADAGVASPGDLRPGDTFGMTPGGLSQGDAVLRETQLLTAVASGNDDIFRQMYQESMTLMSIDMVEAMARAYGGIPGRKSLIWMAPVPPFPPMSTNAQIDTRTARALLELRNANMAVYPLDSNGLVATPVRIETSRERYEAAGRVQGGFGANTSTRQVDAAISARNSEMQQMSDTINKPAGNMRWIADATGGKAFLKNNDMAGSLARAMDDSTQYYQLSYYVQKDVMPGWHPISVKVNQSGMDVRARSGVFIGRLTAHDNPRADVMQALGSPYEMTSVPLVVRWTGQGGNDGEPKRIDFELSVLPRGITIDDTDNNHVSLTMKMIARNAEGKLTGDLTRNIESHLAPDRVQQFARAGLNFSSAFGMEKGSYSVKFLVRDNLSGRVGTVTAPLEVQ
jgi:VWFA-related protein